MNTPKYIYGVILLGVIVVLTSFIFAFTSGNFSYLYVVSVGIILIAVGVGLLTANIKHKSILKKH